MSRRARACDFGYKLEHFWLVEPGLTPERFGDLLATRSINGLIIGRPPPRLHTMDLRWSRFSTVTLGLTLGNPRLHSVTKQSPPVSGPD